MSHATPGSHGSSHGSAAPLAGHGHAGGGHTHGFSDLTEDITQALSTDAAKAVFQGNNSRPALWAARSFRAVYDFLPLPEYSGKFFSIMMGHALASFAVNLTNMKGAKKQLAKDMLENALTGGLIGSFEHASHMTDEELASAIEAANAAKSAGATASPAHGVESAVVAILPTATGTKMAHAPKVRGGLIDRDTYGTEASVCDVYNGLVRQHYAVALRPAKRSSGGKTGGTVDTGTMVLSQPLGNLHLTEEEFVDGINNGMIEPCPTCFPKRHDDWKEGRRAKIRVAPDPHHAHPAMPDWMAGASDRVVAMLVASQALAPTWYQAVLADDFGGDLMKQGMRLRLLEATMHKLASTTVGGERPGFWSRLRRGTPAAPQMMLEFKPSHIDPHVEVAQFNGYEGIDILMREIDVFGPGKKDVTTRMAGVVSSVSTFFSRNWGWAVVAVVAFALLMWFPGIGLWHHISALGTKILGQFGYTDIWGAVRDLLSSIFPQANPNDAAQVNLARAVKVGWFVLVFTWIFAFLQAIHDLWKGEARKEAIKNVGRAIVGVLVVVSIINFIHILATLAGYLFGSPAWVQTGEFFMVTAGNFALMLGVATPIIMRYNGNPEEAKDSSLLNLLSLQGISGGTLWVIILGGSALMLGYGTVQTLGLQDEIARGFQDVFQKSPQAQVAPAPAPVVVPAPVAVPVAVPVPVAQPVPAQVAPAPARAGGGSLRKQACDNGLLPPGSCPPR